MPSRRPPSRAPSRRPPEKPKAASEAAGDGGRVLFPIREERDRWTEELRRLLRARVRQASVRQLEIAEANGFSPGYVSHMISGRVPLIFDRIVGVLLAIGEPPEAFFREVFTGHDPRRGADEIREGLDEIQAALAQLRERGLLDPAAPAAAPSRRKTRQR